MKNQEVILGDCIEEMKKMPDNSVDAIITDPPYELGFMGKSWDNTGIANNPEMWKECLRVLKPGGYLLSFGGTRTYHRMAVAIEDAGFEVRDMIEWVYGSGFPKSLNIGKAVDKLQGNEREEFENKKGWGTALKPAHEPICMARKPLAEKTVAENVLKYGTGGINIDESRVEAIDGGWKPTKQCNISSKGHKGGAWGNETFVSERTDVVQEMNNLGRFPANLIHDNSEEVRECFPDNKDNSIRKLVCDRRGHGPSLGDVCYGEYNAKNDTPVYNDGGGSASRFFKSIIYTAKASKSERNMGCEELENKETPYGSGGGAMPSGNDNPNKTTSKNNHPTVKPIKLMEYLIKMVTPTGGIVLDPFAGSGTTLIACKQLGYNFIGIEKEAEYVKIIEARLSSIQNLKTLKEKK